MASAGPPVGGAAQPPPPPSQPGPQPYSQPGPAGYQPAATGLTDNAACGLCYLVGLITGIVFLVLAPYNQNKAIRFHAFQSIFLNVAYIVFWFVLSFLIALVHFVGALFGLFLGPLIGLGFFVLWLYVMIQAFQGKTVVLPIIGPLAQQQA